MIKVISFDWNGTLINFNGFDEVFWFTAVPELYAKKHNLSFKEAKKIVLEKYNKKGSHNPEWYCPSFWFKKFGFEEDWKEELEKSLEVVDIYPEIKEVLDILKNKFRLFCFSRSARELVQTNLEVLGLIDYLEGIFSTASDFNCSQKNKEAYLQVCDKMNVKPSEVLHIGDSYERDYLEPKKAGLNVVFLDRNGTGKVQGSVKDLKEFLGKVETFLN